MSVVGLLLVTAALVASGQNAADERLIFDPTPEAPDAQKQGAADVEAAQKLAKQKQFADAAAVLERVARTWPASVHDCNLALAYLRASALTRAQLAWDLSGLRNGPRPKWCTGEVSTQLSEALRAAKYVPTSLDIVPSDALVEVGGAALRNMRTVWLPSGQSVITASAPGRETKSVTVTVASPSTRVAITLEAPRPVQADAGVVEPMATPDAAVTVVVPPPDAAPIVQSPPPEETVRVPGSSAGVRIASLTAAIVGWVGVGVFGYLTYDAKDSANEHYASDPVFATRKDTYDTYSVLTLASAIVGAAATGAYVYFATRPETTVTRPAHVDVGVGANGSFGISYSGTFGGGSR